MILMLMEKIYYFKVVEKNQQREETLVTIFIKGYWWFDNSYCNDNIILKMNQYLFIVADLENNLVATD